jgi:hypothetical protein
LDVKFFEVGNIEYVPKVRVTQYDMHVRTHTGCHNLWVPLIGRNGCLQQIGVHNSEVAALLQVTSADMALYLFCSAGVLFLCRFVLVLLGAGLGVGVTSDREFRRRPK